MGPGGYRKSATLGEAASADREVAWKATQKKKISTIAATISTVIIRRPFIRVVGVVVVAATATHGDCHISISLFSFRKSDYLVLGRQGLAASLNHKQG